MVTAELEPPAGAAELDALQQEGVVALLDRRLALVEGVTGPDETDIDVLDFRISTRPNGANVELLLDAPTLAAAEWAAATVLDELLGEIELLHAWTVADSEVRITEDEFNQSLAAADELAEPDGAPAELQAAVEEALESAPEPSWETDRWRETLLECAERMGAFGAEAFTPPGGSADAAKLAAGALIHAVRVVTDEIFYDELSLAINNATVHEAAGLLVLEELPDCYSEHYDSTFARAFLLSSAVVAQRLTAPEWIPPRCTAEALALRLFVHEAQVLLEAANLLDLPASDPVFRQFASVAFADTGYEELYDIDVQLDEDADRALLTEVEDRLRERGLAFDQWFTPRAGADRSVHPYLHFL